MIVDQLLEDKVRSICSRLNLSDVFNWVKEKNPSNNLPYHNWYHALCMVEKVVEGANFHYLPYRSIRHLVVAALFHDFAHTGGKESDTININRALQGLWAFADRSPGRTVSPGIDMFEVEELIGVTEYPYVLDPLCAEHKIIRDADLMQGFRETWKEMIIDGLRQELAVKFKREVPELEMCHLQVSFVNNVIANSGWCSSIIDGPDYPSNRVLAVNRLRTHINLLQKSA